MAHNEAANVGALLDRLLSQRLSRARIADTTLEAGLEFQLLYATE